MRAQAYILLLASLVYTMETIQLPAKIAMAQDQPASAGLPLPTALSVSTRVPAVTGMSGRCCRSMKKDACHKTAHAPTPKGKCPTRDCGDTANCSNCPLCYLATLTAIYLPEPLYLLYTADFPGMPTGAISDYYCQSWKPPDAA
jgi:hypothetical protein